MKLAKLLPMKQKRSGPPAGQGGCDHDATGGGPTLPAWKAFVVQFSRETSTSAGAYSGRVEHLNSGQRGRFSSPDELLALLGRLLDEYAKG